MWMKRGRTSAIFMFCGGGNFLPAACGSGSPPAELDRLLGAMFHAHCCLRDEGGVSRYSDGFAKGMFGRVRTCHSIPGLLARLVPYTERSLGQGSVRPRYVPYRTHQLGSVRTRYLVPGASIGSARPPRLPRVPVSKAKKFTVLRLIVPND